jgi:hypothetical protein
MQANTARTATGLCVCALRGKDSAALDALCDVTFSAGAVTKYDQRRREWRTIVCAAELQSAAQK